MAKITPVYYDPSIPLPEMSKEDLKACAAFWAQVLAHPDVRLMKPEAAIPANVIFEHPKYVSAWSAYKIVYYVDWSRGNPDFTEESRGVLTVVQRIFRWSYNVVRRLLGKPEDKGFNLNMVKKVIIKLIGEKYHPDLVHEENAVNLWMDRKPDAVFGASPV